MPASFPTSLKVFTTRADGEVVYAAHMNEVQEEVAAIQSELGTDPSGTSYTTVKARIAAVETAAAGAHAHDHGALSGLADDDHTQYILKSIGTTKGDILAYTGSGVVVRLPVGATNGHALIVNSAQATGMNWAAIYAPGGTDVAITDGGTGASDATTARSNLGLGTMATQAASAVAITGGTVAGITDLAVADGGTGASDATTARSNLGLGNVNNTSDAAKPVSTAQQTALDLKANLASPTFTGTPAAPTAAVGTDTTQLATTAFVKAQTRTVRIPHTWHIPGEVKVASGDTDFINPMFVPVSGSNVSATLVAVLYRINSGTSVTFKMQKATNANNTFSDVTGFTGMSATTADASTAPTGVALANGDKLVPVITAVSGTPKNMIVTAYVDYTF